jgi:lipoyl(octanoyl) transferase
MAHGAPPPLLVCELGTIEYSAAAQLQARLRDLRQRDAIDDVLLVLEHPPVYTRGRRSEPGELPMGEDWYRSQGIDVVATDRGGRLTYHGPGQLVGYPIVRITDVVAYLRRLETAICAALAGEGIDAGPREGLTGVWVDDRKIASIGVHVSRGVTTHGFAVNVDNDLQPFSWVVPCGLEGVQMTSVLRESGRRAPDLLPRFARAATAELAQALDRQPRSISPQELDTASVGLVA